ncbi:MAG: dipicolinate synthase subunit B [Eubacterium sp.]
MSQNETSKSEQITIGLAFTGSFCTYAKIKEVVRKLVAMNMNVIPVFSESAQNIDSRFGKASDFINEILEITGEEGIFSISQAEPIGPSACLDALLIAPCTGNTLAKLCAGITDTPVLMAAKAHLRNEKPLIISISTNDALSMNFKNIGALMNMKNIYFVPFGQDNYRNKPNSMISHVELIPVTVIEALKGKQIQPVIDSPFQPGKP